MSLSFKAENLTGISGRTTLKSNLTQKNLLPDQCRQMLTSLKGSVLQFQTYANPEKVETDIQTLTDKLEQWMQSVSNLPRKKDEIRVILTVISDALTLLNVEGLEDHYQNFIGEIAGKCQKLLPEHQLRRVLEEMPIPEHDKAKSDLLLTLKEKMPPVEINLTSLSHIPSSITVLSPSLPELTERTVLNQEEMLQLKFPQRTVGGKGTGLIELVKRGHAVPPFFGITTNTYWQLMALTVTAKDIAKVVPELMPHLSKLIQPTELEETPPAITLQDLAKKAETLQSPVKELVCEFLEHYLTSEALMVRFMELPCVRDMLKEYESLGKNIPVAVRSSSTVEDGKKASSAGVYKTVLGAVGPEAFIQAYLQSVSSNFTLPAYEYRELNDLNVNSGYAVVVQEMYPSEWSGVLFTKDPMSDNMIINIAPGLGETLVSSECVPLQVYVNRSTGEITQVVPGQTEHYYVLNPKTGKVEKKEWDKKTIESTDIPNFKSLIKKLYKDAKKEENARELFLDMEWGASSVHSRKVVLLQERPATVSARLTFPRGLELSVPPLVSSEPLANGFVSGPIVFVEKESDVARISQPCVLLIDHGSDNLYPYLNKIVLGLIVQRGGRLDHMSIVCSEMKVPVLLVSEETFTGLEKGITEKTLPAKVTLVAGKIGGTFQSVLYGGDLTTDITPHAKWEVGLPEYSLEPEKTALKKFSSLEIQLPEQILSGQLTESILNFNQTFAAMLEINSQLLRLFDESGGGVVGLMLNTDSSLFITPPDMHKGDYHEQVTKALTAFKEGLDVFFEGLQLFVKGYQNIAMTYKNGKLEENAIALSIGVTTVQEKCSDILNQLITHYNDIPFTDKVALFEQVKTLVIKTSFTSGTDVLTVLPDQCVSAHDIIMYCHRHMFSDLNPKNGSVLFKNVTPSLTLSHFGETMGGGYEGVKKSTPYSILNLCSASPTWQSSLIMFLPSIGASMGVMSKAIPTVIQMDNAISCDIPLGHHSMEIQVIKDIKSGDANRIIVRYAEGYDGPKFWSRIFNIKKLAEALFGSHLRNERFEKASRSYCFEIANLEFDSGSGSFLSALNIMKQVGKIFTMFTYDTDSIIYKGLETWEGLTATLQSESHVICPNLKYALEMTTFEFGLEPDYNNTSQRRTYTTSLTGFYRHWENVMNRSPEIPMAFSDTLLQLIHDYPHSVRGNFELLAEVIQLYSTQFELTTENLDILCNRLKYIYDSFNEDDGILRRYLQLETEFISSPLECRWGQSLIELQIMHQTDMKDLIQLLKKAKPQHREALESELKAFLQKISLNDPEMAAQFLEILSHSFFIENTGFITEVAFMVLRNHFSPFSHQVSDFIKGLFSPPDTETPYTTFLAPLSHWLPILKLLPEKELNDVVDMLWNEMRVTGYKGKVEEWYDHFQFEEEKLKNFATQLGLKEIPMNNMGEPNGKKIEPILKEKFIKALKEMLFFEG